MVLLYKLGDSYEISSAYGKDYVVIEADSKNAADNILHTEEEIKDAIDKSSLIMLAKPPKSIAKVIQK